MSDTFPDETLYPVLETLADEDRIFASNSAAGHESSQIKGSTIKKTSAYSFHNGGEATGVPWRIHGCNGTVVLTLPAGVPIGTEIGVFAGVTVVSTVTITRAGSDMIYTPSGAASSFSVTGFGRYFTVVKTISSSWNICGLEDSAIAASLAGKAPLASPALTGTPTAPTAAAGTNTTQLATTAFVTGALASKANDADVVKLTGNQSIGGTKTFTASPVLPTPTAGDNTTKGATTAFVKAAVAGVTASSIGLGSVDNTSDINKPVSTEQAAALDLKQDKSNAITTNTNQVVTGQKTFRDRSNYFGPEEAANHDALAFGCGSTQFWKVRQYTSGALWIQARHPVTLAWENTLTFVFNAGIPYVQLYGTPIAPTAAPGTNTTQLATTAFVQAALTGASGVPAGVICMWSGTIATVPSGWALCDGANGTPDLVDRFVVAAGSKAGGDKYDPGDTGGLDSVTLDLTQIPAHTHAGTTYGGGAHTHDVAYWNGSSGPNPMIDKRDAAAGSGGENPNWYATDWHYGHDHAFTTDSKGGGGSHENRPPYYALAFIMKL